MFKITARSYALATMYLGIAGTLAGNAAVADWADPTAVIISAWPAVALFVTFEMTTRVAAKPSRRRWYHHVMRLAPALAIMAISAQASYGHLLHLSRTHGQHGLSAYLLAALPDAMMLLAAVVLKDSPKTRTAPAAKPAAAKATRKAPARKPAAKTAPPAAAPQVLVPAARRARGHLSLLTNPVTAS